ncbi:MAG: hypothetical protein MRJ65_05935 [Candidatus Brocadiaceae bacterium]|nr:hypothetical protein [Candidatus Brocadiaceae bacterium]
MEDSDLFGNSGLVLILDGNGLGPVSTGIINKGIMNLFPKTVAGGEGDAPGKGGIGQVSRPVVLMDGCGAVDGFSDFEAVIMNAWIWVFDGPNATGTTGEGVKARAVDVVRGLGYRIESDFVLGFGKGNNIRGRLRGLGLPEIPGGVFDLNGFGGTFYR